jgi:putative tryptophan/tyrosine transport system substrate-binding protein
MRRREFVAALGVAATWPLPLLAQQRIPRVAYFGAASAEIEKPFFEAFEAGLRELGYFPGKNIEIVSRYTDGHDDRMAEQAKELAVLKVDVILTAGLGVYAAHAATSAIPIVTAASGDLVATGFAGSLGHPGGNVTGQSIFLPEVLAKRVALLQQVKPAMKSVGVLFPQSYPSAPAYLQAMDAPVTALGLQLKPIEIAEPNDCDRALSSGPGASIDGLVVIEVAKFDAGPGPAAIATAAARHGVPTAGSPKVARNSGFLLGFGVDLGPMFHRAAVFVDKILKGGKPGDIPIERATKFITIVNLRTAAALGLEIPPSVLTQADEVIE